MLLCRIDRYAKHTTAGLGVMRANHSTVLLRGFLISGVCAVRVLLSFSGRKKERKRDHGYQSELCGFDGKRGK